MIYGYAWASTDGQSADAEVKQLRAAGAEKVFRDTAGGEQTDRAQLCRVLAQIGKGDVLIVTRPAHIARSTRDLFNMLGTITGKGAGFRSLGEAWADTTTGEGCLILTVLGGLVEFEREFCTTSETHDDAGATWGRQCSKALANGRARRVTTSHEISIHRDDRGNYDTRHYPDATVQLRQQPRADALIS